MKKVVSIALLAAMLICSLGIMVVSASAEASSASISIEDRELASGDSITVSYSGITSNAEKNTRVEIYYIGDTLDGWWDPTSKCRLTDENGNVLRGESGTIVFPRDDENGVTRYQDGKYQVVLFDGQRNKLDRIVVTIGNAPKISVAKNTFAPDESIDVTWENITPDLGKNLEVRIYNANDRVGLVEAYAFFALTDADAELIDESSGTLSFPEVWLEPGEYKILLVSGAGLQNILHERINITIAEEGEEPTKEPVESTTAEPTKEPSESTPTEPAAEASSASISIENKELASGDSITVSYSGITSNAEKNTRVEIYYIGDTLDGWWDPTSKCRLTDEEGKVLKGESGTIVFPRDDENGVSRYQDGKYQVVLFDGQRNQLDRIVVTIGNAPKISVAKNTFAPDESIDVSWENITPDLGKNLEVRIYNADDRVGLVEAYAFFALTDAYAELIDESSGTLSFPEVWLEPGEYKILLVSGAGLQNILHERINITITEESEGPTKEPVETNTTEPTMEPSETTEPTATESTVTVEPSDSNDKPDGNSADNKKNDGLSPLALVLCIVAGVAIVVAAATVIVLKIKKKK